jgi:hypothetical protein
MLPHLPFLWSYGVFRCSVSFHLRVVIAFRDNYLCNNYTLFMIFGYL